MKKGPRRALIEPFGFSICEKWETVYTRRVLDRRQMKKGAPRGGDPPRRPRARARRMRVERRPPVSGALLSHGLTPQYHRRSAA